MTILMSISWFYIILLLNLYINCYANIQSYIRYYLCGNLGLGHMGFLYAISASSCESTIISKQKVK